ncbi:ABC transporter permease [Gordonia polyisoprenivorans]|uniref:ABC transporter permease n=1 Tax=Gordonia polyisoprenivorans TaxID=84595 RepID=UPI000B99E36E|nr:ABC transporter permease [Gordonia polyisoprenivorans]MBE7195751.1 ABC transporter permease [Gordonia polyisoprenivorans]OZC33628.1 ABC transporter [Gordonia polyisoprenivorans]QUD85810.1 ABC transporter permease [Gordonia polyisoprenivorans]UZF57047.1 ABC transporter permease [Gordonia polyisoprenivorans]
MSAATGGGQLSAATGIPTPGLHLGTPVDHIGIGKAIRDTITMARRGLLRLKHTPQQLFDVIVIPIVFTVMFANIFGGAIAGSVDAYLPQLVPGVLVSVAITASVVTGVQLREDMDRGVFDRFISLPIARIAPLAGSLIADVVRYLIAAVMSIGVGMILGYRPSSVLGTIAGIILTLFAAFAISWIFALMGVLMSKASAVQGVSMLVLMPLTFTSNIFVPVTTMPSWMRTLADVNPISHLVSSLRSLINDGQVTAHVGWTLIGAVAIIVVVAPITVRAYLRQA